MDQGGISPLKEKARASHVLSKKLKQASQGEEMDDSSPKRTPSPAHSAHSAGLAGLRPRSHNPSVVDSCSSSASSSGLRYHMHISQRTDSPVASKSESDEISSSSVDKSDDDAGGSDIINQRNSGSDGVNQQGE